MARMIQRAREEVSRFETKLAEEMPSPIGRGSLYSLIPAELIGGAAAITGRVYDDYSLTAIGMAYICAAVSSILPISAFFVRRNKMQFSHAQTC